MQFEWNEEKNRINLKKHGIAFEDAVYVFNDDNRLELYDASHSDNEERYIAIGKVNKVLFVVYTKEMRKHKIDFCKTCKCRRRTKIL